ncbi:hypothetical protein Tco_0968372 [Tanacetum coccineum]
MATFKVLDELIEIIGSTELHKRMRFWFMQEISEEEGFLRFLRDDLRRRNTRRCVLIGEMEALGARGWDGIREKEVHVAKMDLIDKDVRDVDDID